MTFSWINRTEWVHEVMCEFKMIWLRKEWKHVEYWIKIDDKRALIEQNSYKKALTKHNDMSR
jgi:hypothetical protein